ncbi:hypothetical protein FRB97_007117 [Tulasnella sp. 331]|nr:hypothetical protein FRB97_007117 [Tulasnella sp. 331]
MGPTVETLNLFLKTQGSATWRIPEADDPQKISDFFTRMVMLCPNLTDLTLGGQGIGVESIAVATQSIKQLRGLQSVYLSNNDDRDVTAILLGMSELPALESLTLDCLVNFPSQWPHSTTPFPKLKKVFVKWPSHSGTETFLRTLVSTESHLTDLALGEELTGYILDLKGMMILVGEHERLESLVMHSRQDKERLNITTLTPILRCRILSTLILDHEGDVELTDDDIETLASNLTQLVHLTLPSCNTEPTSPLTLRAISIVVSLCPDLETLWIEVDAREVIPQEQHAHVAPHKYLRQLNLGVSLGSREVNDMAYFIAGLSDVEDFRIAYDLNGMLKWRWAAVNAALPAMRMKRKADMD